LNPTLAASVFVEGLAWANEGHPEEAKKCIRRAIALEPDNARFHCHMGILFLRENQYSEAEQSFRKSIELKPEYALPHYELGKLRKESKQWKEAAAELDKSIALDPGLTSAYYQIALVYGKLGERDKAEHALGEFKKFHQQELDESEAVDGDARQESDSH
jgi:tetratricopeptide (TPR) repeat protein